MRREKKINIFNSPEKRLGERAKKEDEERNKDGEVVETDKSLSFDDFPREIESCRDSFLTEHRFSMLSRPNEVEAVIPDLESANEEDLKDLGLQKEGSDWHVPNRDHFPSPLTENSVIINYGEKEIIKEDGSRASVPDLGFCSKEKFESIYTYSDDYKNGDVRYVNSKNMTPGEKINATKCATGSFIFMPEGTKVRTNEGDVEISSGQVVVADEFEDTVYVTDISQVLKRYNPDSMNLSSGKAFELMENFYQESEGKSPEELSETHKDLVSKYFNIERGEKAYGAYVKEVEEETLKDHYRKAMEVVTEMEKEMSDRISGEKEDPVFNFGERLNNAKNVLREIMKDDSLTKEQKDIKISYVKAKLLPKTNNHQHLKGSVTQETVLRLAEKHGFNEEQVDKIEKMYSKGIEGFDNLDQFNEAYATITSAVRTQEDYRNAVKDVMKKATQEGQVTVEIRSSIIGQRELNEDGELGLIKPEEAGENILRAIREANDEIGKEAPKTGFVILAYRGEDGEPAEVKQHAELAIDFAKKYPEKKFGFDIAGPEDTGYNLMYFKESFELIKSYNKKVETGEIRGEKIGITAHAGETPTYKEGDENDKALGYEAVREALELGVDRIGHGVQAITDPETVKLIKERGAVVEICGVCNISSIPINTEGMTLHPVEGFLSSEIPVSICTDNCGVCGTGITKEYAQFLLTGHEKIMNWNNVKKIARHGIESSFISEKEKKEALEIYRKRIREVEVAVSDARDEVELEKIRGETEEAA